MAKQDDDETFIESLSHFYWRQWRLNIDAARIDTERLRLALLDGYGQVSRGEIITPCLNSLVERRAQIKHSHDLWQAHTKEEAKIREEKAARKRKTAKAKPKPKAKAMARRRAA